MSIKPDIISVTNTCSDILFRNVCPQLRSKDIGNLLPTCKAVEECFKEYFKEDLKGLNNFKERALTNSVMCATGEETPGLLTVYFKKNNTIGLKVLIKSERLNTIKNKHLNLTPS